MLPDGPPVLGASGAPGVWLNLGHGSSGWALACGSARVLADVIAGRAAPLDTRGLAPTRAALNVEAACGAQPGHRAPHNAVHAEPATLRPADRGQHQPARWPLHDAAASRRIERAALAGLQPHALMERAGLAVARLALAIAPHAAAGRASGRARQQRRRRPGRRAAPAPAGLAVVVRLVGDAAALPADAARALRRRREAGVAMQSACRGDRPAPTPTWPSTHCWASGAHARARRRDGRGDRRDQRQLRRRCWRSTCPPACTPDTGAPAGRCRGARDGDAGAADA